MIAIGQPGNDSPYSRYGIGNIIDNGNIRSAGLGGLYVALDKVEERQINFLNPASYIDIDSHRVVLDASVNWTIADLSDNSGSEYVNKANFGHIALGLPVTKWMGASFGLRPLSISEYRVSRGENTPEADSITHIFEGDGGLNQFYVGFAVRPVKGLSIGANLGYVFGSFGTIQRTEFSSPFYFNTKYSNAARISSISMDYGIQYRISKGKSGFTVGLTASAPWKLQGDLVQLGSTYTLSAFGEDIVRDTILSQESSDAFVQMPLKLGVGFAYTFNDKVMAGVQFNNESWSDFRSIDGQTDSLSDSWRLSAGLEFRPGFEDRGWLNYFKKIHYRIGGFYATSPITLNGTQLPQYGITLGFGFPIKHRSTSGPIVSSIINGAVEIGQRGDPNANHLVEQYINFKLGFSLNDRWFLKRKYN
jgi:hypothetical protein